MFLFRAFDTFVVKVDGGHQLSKRRVLKHHTTYRMLLLRLHQHALLWIATIY
jgi:hypothetical protein